ncbi:helix-turn-helix transcriptional regulator [Moraxella bovoculi]|uniref:helix-turn-helix transcriptional regulator n=1 Tax=Moraxella bovoculi TaxID=386891 RepID=UPI0009BB7FD0|nr:WYL domain-containing protein [Moraxella bovoculi]
MNDFFASAERHLRDQTKPQVSAWGNKVASVPPTQPLLPPTMDDDVFANISQALFENRHLDITYQAQRKKPKPATVMPLALVRQEPRLYLVVKYKGYKDVRHLAVNRIKSAKISMFDFKRPDDFDLQDYITKGHFGISDGSQIRLSFCIGKSQGFHLTESPLSTDQTVQEFDSHYHISATAPDSEMLDWWLAKFGDKVWDIKRDDME